MYAIRSYYDPIQGVIMKHNLNEYIQFLIEKHGSDLHIKSGSSVHYRVNGDLYSLKDSDCSITEVEQIAQSMLSEKEYQSLQDTKELDIDYKFDEHNHFRVNFFV